ncbi:MAG: sodium:proton antiporter, partial [Gemmatimonadota bacterium]|nr:sodium:proton antiporter [Gemmatimonadota bacterium]
LLYCIATVVAIASRRLRVPYTTSLLLAGIALGAMHFASLPHLTRELLFEVFLPGLLFEAAYHLEVHELRENSWTISLMAVPGVVIAIALTATLLVGGALLAGGHLTWQTAFLFGGVIAATDPVAVTALFRQLGAPRRLHVLVESESLLNDGTSIVFLTLMLAFFAGEATSASSLAMDFVRIAAGGAALGGIIGWGVSHIRTHVDDAAIEITLTTIAAYGSFIVAEQLHCSGVIATVAAGVACGNAGRHHPMTANTRAAVDSFWEWLAFALNSGVFLLLGAQLSLDLLLDNWFLIVLAAVATLCARAIVVGLAGALIARTAERLPRTWLVVMTWGGLRGALSLVLALALPDSIVGRDLIIVMTAGTVALSLVGQAATMPALLRRLGIGATAEALEVGV